MGSSDKVQSDSTDFTIKDLKGAAAFKMHRASRSGADVWEVTVFNKALIHPRLVLIIPAFKTAADNRSDD